MHLRTQLTIVCATLAFLFCLNSSTAEAASDPDFNFLYYYTRGKKTNAKGKLQKLLSKNKLKQKIIRRISGYMGRFVRNTIFALKGAKFRSADLRKFFAKQKWYKGKVSASKISLNANEKYNVKKILMASAINSAMSSFDSVWPRDAYFLGPKQDARTRTICMRYATHDILRTKSHFIVQKTAKTCRLKASLRVFRVAKKEFNFGGFASGHLMLRRFGSSDMIDLRIYHVASKKVVFHRNEMSASAAPAFDGKGNFTYSGGVKFPKSCGSASYGSDSKYNKWLKACWPKLQKLHSGLKGQSAPKCKCRGLSPGLLVKQVLPLNNLVGPPQLGKVTCSCSS